MLQLFFSSLITLFITSTNGNVFGQTTLPYTDNFNTNNGWVFSSKNVSNWYISPLTGNPGNSMYVSRNGGQSNTYMDTSIVRAKQTFALPASANNALVRFDVKMLGEGSTTKYDYLNVWVLPAGSTVALNTLIADQTITSKTLLLDKYNRTVSADSTVWYPQLLQIPSSFNGTNVDLYFEFRSDGSTRTNPAPAIDNFSIIAPTCSNPTTLASSNVSFNSVNLSFSNATAPQYAVYANSVFHSVISGPGILTGLNPTTSYSIYLRAICSPGDTSIASNAITFTTTCAPMSAFHYDFENLATSVVPTCWAKVGTTGTVYTSASYGFNNSTRSFYMYSGSTTAHAMVRVNELSNLGAGTNRLRLYARTSATANLSGTIMEIGYLTDPTLQSSFVMIQKDTLTANYKEIICVPPAGINASYLAIRTTGNKSLNYIYFDDISWELNNPCPIPGSPIVSNITDNSATIKWPLVTPNTGAYVVYLNGVSVGTSTSDSLVVTNLSADTNYGVSIAADCGTSVSYAGLTTNFKTQCSLVSNFFEDFGIGSTLPSCFEKVGTGGYALIANSTTNSIAGSRLEVYSNVVLKLTEVNNMGAGTHRLRFFARPFNATLAANPVLHVGYVTDRTNSASFVVVDSIVLPQSSGLYAEYFVQYPAGLNHTMLAIRSGKNLGTATASDILIDNMYWEVTPSCVSPTSVIVSDIQANDVKVSWDYAVPAAPSYLVYVNGAYYTTVNAIDHAYITGLNPQTTYQVSLASLCGPADTSSFTTPLSFTTSCALLTSYYEDFGTTGSALPACFGKVGTTGTTSIGTTGSVSGNRLNIYAAATLRLNEVSNMGAGTHRLRFSARPSSSTLAANPVLLIGYVTDRNNPATFVKIDSIVLPQTTALYTEYNIQIPAGINQTMMAIKAGVNVGTTTNSNIYVDDIHWEALPSCIIPSSVLVKNITANTATVKWTQPNPVAANYLVYVNNAYHATVAANDSINLSGLNDNSTFTVKVASFCSLTDTSTFTSNVSFTTPCSLVSNFYEDFGTTGTAVPTCFSKVGTTGTVTVSATNSMAGNRINVAALGTLKLKEVSNMSAGTHRLRFFARPSLGTLTTNPVLLVGYLTDRTDATSFVKVDSIVLPASSALYGEYIVSYPAGLNQTILAVKGSRNVGTAVNSDILIDNMYWEAIPSCTNPTQITVSAVTSAGATVKWNNPSPAPANYLVYVNGSVHSTTTADSIVLASFNPLTSYSVNIASLCGPQDTSNLSLPVSFTTLCGVYTSFYEDFGTTGSTLPPCFAKVGATGTTSIGTLYSVAGNRLNIYGGATLKLNDVSNMGAATHRLRFSARPYTASSANTQPLYVGYVTDASDPTSFVVIDSIVFAPNTGIHQQFIFNYPAIANQTMLAIKGGVNRGLTTFSDIVVDDIYWEAKPICAAPTALVISNLTQTGAVVTFNESTSTPPNYLIFVNGSYYSTVTDTTAIISGLTAGTAYQISVKSLCAPTDSSVFTPITQLTTACLPTVISALGHCEDFDNGLGCWTVNNQNADAQTWEAFQGAIRMTTDNLAGANNDYLISNGLTLSPNQAMKFKYKTDNNVDLEEMRVLLSTTGNAPADFTTILVNNFTFANTTYAEMVVDLSAYAGQTVHVAFHIPTGVTDGSIVYIDDVCFNECMPSAGADQALSACLNTASMDLATAVTVLNNTGYFASANPAITNALSGTVLNFASLSAGTYAIDYIVAGWCANDTLTVSLTLNADAHAGLDQTLTACQNDGTIDLATVLTLADANGIFTSNDIHVAAALNGTQLNLSTLVAGSYTIDYIVTGICSNDTLQVALTVNASADAGLDATIAACMNEPISLNTIKDPAVYTTGTWYEGNQALNTATPFITPNAGGDVQLMFVSTSTACGNDTAYVTIQVAASCDYLGVNVLSFDSANIYPNPTTGKVTIDVANNTAGYTYRIMDVNGRIVAESTEFIYENSFDLNLESAQEGIYLIQIANSSTSKVFRVVKN